MLRVTRTIGLILVTCALSAGVAWGVVVVAPLEAQHPDVGAVFEPTERSVTIIVRDERPYKLFVAGAQVGPGAGKGKGFYIGYATEKNEDLAPFVQAAANDALRNLGVKAGAGMTLEIVIRDFRIDLVRMSGFSPMNCIGYGILEASLKGPDGSEIRKKTLQVADWEDTVPVGSMKEVQKEAISRIFSHAAWETTASILLDEWKLTPNAAEIERLVKGLDKVKDEIPAGEQIFWLGLSRDSGDQVKDKLLSILKTSKESKLREAAAKALGRLGAAQLRDEVSRILSGDAKSGDWDTTDTEQVWYLIDSLAALGEKDLRARVPATGMNMPQKVQDLVSFRETGEIPKAGAAELEKRAKAEETLMKKRQ